MIEIITDGDGNVEDIPFDIHCAIGDSYIRVGNRLLEDNF